MSPLGVGDRPSEERDGVERGTGRVKACVGAGSAYGRSNRLLNAVLFACYAC